MPQGDWLIIVIVLVAFPQRWFQFIQADSIVTLSSRASLIGLCNYEIETKQRDATELLYTTFPWVTTPYAIDQERLAVSRGILNKAGHEILAMNSYIIVDL